MKTKIKFAVVCICLATLHPQLATVFAQGTAFTYQGRLQDGGSPADGIYGLQFTIYDLENGGSAVAGPLTNAPVAVSDGLFTVALDFGVGVFDGSERWLEIGVRTNGGGAFIPLSPRQQLTATPYAIAAGNVTGVVPSGGVAGTYSSAVTFDHAANSFTGSFTGNGGALSNVNATTLNGSSLASLWRTEGNSGTAAGVNFLGTTDDQPLEFKVNGQRVLRLAFHPNTYEFGSPSPSLIGGHPGNEVIPQVSGATIAGGGGSNWWGATQPHRVSGHFGTIGGGVGNEVQGDVGVIAGGERGFLGINAFNAFLGGGAWNAIHAGDATIGGGRSNTNRPGAYAATIGGGAMNTVQTNASYAAIGGGERNSILAGTIHSVIGGGARNVIGANTSGVFIGGGGDNTNRGNVATISGGYRNRIEAGGNAPAIGGGVENVIGNNAHGAFIGGGIRNSIGPNISDATIPGGYQNAVAGLAGFAAGTRAKANHNGAFVWADSQQADFASTAVNQFAVRASGGIRLAGNVELDTSTYRHLLLSGGNSLGYLYGSFPALADGVHLAYNHYYNAAGSGQVFNTGGATSRLTVGYGFVQLAIGGVNAAPTTQRLLANSSGVTVNGTFNNSSDRNAKRDFAPVNATEILDKVTRLPLSEWSYKDDPATRHIGPVAQDFHAAFNIGTDDKHIAPLDEAGVALAAIQGLNQKVELGKQKAETRIEKLEAENAELKQRLEKLERSLAVQLAGGAK